MHLGTSLQGLDLNRVMSGSRGRRRQTDCPVDLEAWDLRPLEGLPASLRVHVAQRGDDDKLSQQRGRERTWLRWAWDDVEWVPVLAPDMHHSWEEQTGSSSIFYSVWSCSQ